MYRIKVKDTLDSAWSAWFDDLTIIQDEDETLLIGMVQDQAALHGLLARIRDLGLTILLVEQLSGQVPETDDS
jgi:hypothetical protein